MSGKYRKIAKKLELKDVGEANIGDRYHFCGERLRFGEDDNNRTVSYCPRCRKTVATIKVPRFTTIKVSPHDD